MVTDRPERLWPLPHNKAKQAAIIAFLNRTKLGPANLVDFLGVKLPCKFRVSLETELPCGLPKSLPARR